MGPFFLAIGNLCTASYVVFQRALLPHYSNFMITAVAYSVGTVLVTFTVAVHVQVSPWPVVFSLGPRDWWTVLYAAVFATMFPYVSIAWASRQVNIIT